MVRLFHVYFPARTLLLAAFECVLIGAALLAANCVVFGADTKLALVYERGAAKIAAVLAVCMICMYYYDLYDSAVLRSSRESTARVVQVLGTMSVMLALLYYAFPELRLRRSLFLMGILLTGAVLGASRKLFFRISGVSRWKERTLLLGDGPLTVRLATEIESRPELGMRAIGYLAEATPGASPVNGLPKLGAAAELDRVVGSERVAHIILSMRERRGNLPVEALLRIKTAGVLVEDAARAYESISGRVPLESLHPSWLLLSDGFRISHGMHVYKRCCSVLGSLAGLIVTLPVMAVIAAAIRLESRGPVIFRQKRVGKGGQEFTLYKFRSMRWDADADGVPVPCQKNDRRITRVGKWLRYAHLDEIPQLYNILIGDMHFVGPRPFTPNTEHEMAEAIPFYAQRWTVSPGATGWAQIRQGYCESLDDNRRKLEYDLFYIKNLSIGLDCLILFETVKVLLLGRGAR